MIEASKTTSKRMKLCLLKIWFGDNLDQSFLKNEAYTKLISKKIRDIEHSQIIIKSIPFLKLSFLSLIKTQLNYEKKDY